MDDKKTSHRLKNEKYSFGLPKKSAKAVETLGKVIRPLQGKEILCAVATKRPK